MKVCREDVARSIRRTLIQSAIHSPIRSLITSICLRRPKNVIVLPCRNDKLHKVDIELDEAVHYKNIEDDTAASLRQRPTDISLSSYANVLTKINYLRQICNLGTYYQGTPWPQLEHDDQSAASQGLFDGMLSTGVLICCKCDKDLLHGNLNSESLLGGSEDSKQVQPRLAECGELICPTCFARHEITAKSNELRCKHRPSCQFFEVKASPSVAIGSTPPKFRLPTKIRALQNDILALPLKEKR